ncbi:MAG: helix-turn-helix transcriptional regulator [Anaerolineae bacterium]|nr:helix-turn-helix transcriptional regulator [Anaerolineae bacterium]
MTDMALFGQWVKSQRLAMGVRQKDFAKQVYCAAVTLRKIEAGDLRPSSDLARIIVEQFGLPPQEQSEMIRLARERSANEL